MLLDPFLADWTRLLTSKLLHYEDCSEICQILYQLCKIKGYKYICKFAPEDINVFT